MTLKRIRLELARDQDFPDGSRERGYDLVAPIGDDDRLVADEWRLNRDRCRVRRFWAGEEERGRLVHKRGGTWAIDYNPQTEDDDEPGFRFDQHRFAPGEYVSLKEHDGHMRTFRIVSVVDLD
jgi:hypothetical protein